MRRHHAGIRTHVSDTMDVRNLRGVLLSDYGRMFVELAELVGLVDLVVVGDHLVRKNWITPDELVAYCATSTHRSARVARRAAAYVRADVDSPMESRLRMLLVLAGLPEPAINVRIRAGDGEVLRRYDLSFPAARVIVEYDGRQHIERVEAWESDLERREAIDDDGWRILVVVSSGIYRSPERTLQRVWRLLRARGLVGVPARLDDVWRTHFPGHSPSGVHV
jgi:very-short-patch-repair endonuclease